VKRSSRAFTLIEVMAAVLILGLFVTVLSEMLVRASRFEGDTRQLAEAAAVADREVAKLEESLLRGSAPAIGKTESREEPWLVTTEVTPFDATLLPGAAPAPSAQPQRAEGDAASPGSWLASPSAQQNPPLLAVDVFVTWEDAAVDAETGEPLGIHRRTYALNPAALESLPGEGEDGGSGGEDSGLEDEGGAQENAAQLEDRT
jgi:prepilin-type N-terminal cleavage/methylation domain-containing protein